MYVSALSVPANSSKFGKSDLSNVEVFKT